MTDAKHNNPPHVLVPLTKEQAQWLATAVDQTQRLGIFGLEMVRQSSGGLTKEKIDKARGVVNEIEMARGIKKALEEALKE